MLVSGNNILLVFNEGVYVFDIPVFKPLEGHLTLAEHQGALQNPAAFIPHSPSDATPTPPSRSLSLRMAARVLSYSCYIIANGSTNAWNKYELHLFPSCIQDSYTVHTHTIGCQSLDKGVAYQATGLFDGTIVGGIRGGRWEGESRSCAWISMLRWESVMEREHDAGTSRALDLVGNSCDLVPFIPWCKVWSGHGPVSFGLCPSSASALVLWSHMEDDNATYWFWLRHYSFG